MSRWLRPLLGLVAVAVLALLALAGVRLYQASRAGERGQHELVAAVALLTPHNGFADLDGATLQKARARIAAARHNFATMHDDLAHAGPAYSLARALPFVRVQVRGVAALDDAGNELSTSALQLVDTAEKFLQPSDKATSLASGDVVGELRTLQSSAQQSVAALSRAIDHLAKLNGYRLVGPLAGARATLAKKLPALEVRAASARDALGAFLRFSGGAGPRTYLVLSQNPAEVRPTGGYMGSYGLVTAVDGHLKVTSYGDTNAWVAAHPKAVIPQKQTLPAIFKIANSDETLANTNAGPDWKAAAATAEDLWHKGGGQHVDGVVSFTPEFLARIVQILGPVRVAAYGDTVTGANLVQRTDYWTHHAPSQPVAGGRKEFLSILAPLVLHKLVTAPATSWPKLGAAAAAGFASQQAMLSSNDPQVESVVTTHRWSYALPRTQSDFYADTEFAFASKNGRGIRRTFDHTVVIAADGSAKITTVMTLHDTLPYDRGYNQSAAGYFTPYGPTGATLDKSSDAPDWNGEPDVNGHPAAGWQLSAPPLGSTTLKVVWDAPQVLIPQPHGRFLYALVWMPTPAHTGDEVRLHVVIPKGWEWVGAPPPATLRPVAVTGGEWMLRKGR